MKRLLLVLTLLFLGILNAFAQESKELRRKENKERPKFLEIGSGLNYSYFRDFATGPIFYEGLVNSFNGHYHRFDSTKETRYGFLFSAGSYGFTVNNESSNTFVNSITLDFGKLYHIQNFIREKYKLKVGGALLLTGNIRSDPALQNASLGYELIYNLMASAKIERDVSRKKEKDVKIWFIRYHLSPRRRHLSYQLNVGLMNSHVRNGYAYVNQEQLLNGSPIFADYENKFFQGFRMNSALRYTIYMNSGNALRFTYLWDAYTTGQENEALEFANHMLSVALLFKL